MTPNMQNSQVQQSPEQATPSNKEINFRQLEAKYERALQQERSERERLQRELQAKSQPIVQEEDESDEPYIDKKSLKKFEKNFELRMEEKIEKKAEEKARKFLEQDKKESWLRNNPDFSDVMQHVDTFANNDPELAETILQMPEGFERQKLVYKNIKALGLHKPKVVEKTIQQKVDENRRSPYYQPSGISNSPYSSVGDYSETGKKNAYDKMKELQNRLRI